MHGAGSKKGGGAVTRREMMRRTGLSLLGLTTGSSPMSPKQCTDIWEDIERLERFSRSCKLLEDARQAVDWSKEDLDALAERLRRPTIVNHHELVLGTKDCFEGWEIARRISQMVENRKGLDIAGSAGWWDQVPFITNLVPSFIGSDYCDFWWCSQNSCHYHFAERKRDDPRLITQQDNDSIETDWLEPGSPRELELGDLKLPLRGTWAYETKEGWPAGRGPGCEAHHRPPGGHARSLSVYGNLAV